MNKAQLIQKIKDRYEDSKALKKFAPEIGVSSFLDGMMTAFSEAAMYTKELEELDIRMVLDELTVIKERLYDTGWWNESQAMVDVIEHLKEKFDEKAK